MLKTCTVQNLGCASCAAKMEKQIAALEGVSACRVNFLTGRMTIDGDEDGMARILGEAERVMRRIEPDVSIKR